MRFKAMSVGLLLETLVLLNGKLFRYALLVLLVLSNSFYQLSSLILMFSDFYYTCRLKFLLGEEDLL